MTYSHIYYSTGKSSILNTLKRCRAVGVSPRPGFTTCMQEVVLDKNVRLIDSPGVVFDDHESLQNGASAAMLRNCIDADSVDDPIPAVQALLNRCTSESLMMTYSIPAFPKGDVMIFLAMIAKRNGKVLKGGIPDKVMAARLVLRDWNSGKIPYYTKPPSIKEENKSIVHNDAKIVSGFDEEFDVNKFDDEILKSLDNNDEMDFVQMEETGAVNDESDNQVDIAFLTGEADNVDEDDGDDIEMDDEDGDDNDDEMESSGMNQRMESTNAVAAEAEDYDFGGM